MIKKSLAAVLAGLCTVTSASALPVATGSAEDAYTMNVTVKLDGTKKEISPYIFGVNEYANSSNLKTLKVNNVRQGGNRFSGYNWETNYSSARQSIIEDGMTYAEDRAQVVAKVKELTAAGLYPEKLWK